MVVKLGLVAVIRLTLDQANVEPFLGGGLDFRHMAIAEINWVVGVARFVDGYDASSEIAVELIMRGKRRNRFAWLKSPLRSGCTMPFQHTQIVAERPTASFAVF
jgi:hypothetical protein